MFFRKRDLPSLVIALMPGLIFMQEFIRKASLNPYGSRRYTLFDDAMISMTYARTLSRTGSLVWYPGAPRVQGFTNPLWTLLMGAIHFAGFEDSRAAFIVSFIGIIQILLLAVLIFALVITTLPSSTSRKFYGLFAAACVPFIYPVTFWTLRGMEVGTLAILVIALLLVAPINSDVRPFRSIQIWLSGLIAVIGITTRFDFCLIYFSVSLFCVGMSNGRKEGRRLLFQMFSPGVLAVMGVLAIQKIYYDDWFPNTYRLKVEGYAVSELIARGISTYSKVLPTTAILVCLLFFVMRANIIGTHATRIVILIAGTYAVTSSYSIWVGGDAWEWSLSANRYLSVSLPALVAMVFIVFANIVNFPSIIPKRTRIFLAFMFFSVAWLIMILDNGPLDLATTRKMNYVASVFLLIFIVLLGRLFIRSLSSTRGSGLLSNTLGICLSSVLMVSTVSSYGLTNWYRQGAIHTFSDQRETEVGIALHAATKPGAKIATVWAGAPSYYSDRSMIDQLGKSDRKIALEKPHFGELLPGHNKWNNAYSIGLLRPDVVYQLPIEPPSDVQLENWGYARWCFVLPGGELATALFLTSSSNINWTQLSQCMGQ